MKKLQDYRFVMLLAGVLAGEAQAQVISLFPTNYAKTILSQNNLGKYWPVWNTETTDTESLDGRVLTVSHVVHFDDVPLYGSRWVAPKMQELRFLFHQIGSVMYRPARVEEIDWGHVGGAITNGWTFPPGTPYIEWKPSLIGLRTFGNRYWRNVEHGTPLVCWCHNISRLPTLLTVKASCDSTAFAYPFRFEPEQSRFITLDLAGATFQLHLARQMVTPDWFTFDLDECTDEPLHH